MKQRLDIPIEEYGNCIIDSINMLLILENMYTMVKNAQPDEQ